MINYAIGNLWVTTFNAFFFIAATAINIAHQDSQGSLAIILKKLNLEVRSSVKYVPTATMMLW